MKYFLLVLYFIAVGIFLSSCTKEDNPTEPGDGDNNTEYPAEPAISEIFPSVAIPNGYIYLIGENFGQTAGTVSVKFKSRANQQEKEGVIQSVEPTKITVKVPADIDTAPEGNEIVVTTPKGTVTNTSTPVYGIESSAFGDTWLPGKGFIGNVYQLEVNTPSLPDFSTMPIKSVLLAPNLDVPTRSFSDGFPGVQGGLVEWFGIKFVGKLVIETAGEYTFHIGSDDGSKLYIDNELIVDNDGTHGYLERSGVVTLPAGEHRIRVDYFQGPRFNIAMRLFWTKPGGQKEIVPAESINLPDIDQIR
ncbi:MAG: hypothetical protein CMF23_03505 [Ignavibacteriae bacterium]|nr:hypothetical protein [Ignavibacteriota bacterium]|tara:strand:- start:47 stop:958 length:912 start_codon:yes stop_codon:yes gene_type:complete